MHRGDDERRQSWAAFSASDWKATVKPWPIRSAATLISSRSRITNSEVGATTETFAALRLRQHAVDLVGRDQHQRQPYCSTNSLTTAAISRAPRAGTIAGISFW
jgi:hypothetical protein